MSKALGNVLFGHDSNVKKTDTPIMAIYHYKGYIGMPGPVEAS